jgi:hypothetical protein
MTLAASGTLWMISTTDGNDRSIMYEVEGVSSTPFSFSTLVTNSNPNLGPLPVSFSDFYGHAQTTDQGRMYATNGWSSTAYIDSANYGQFSSPTTDIVALKYTDPFPGISSDSTYFAQGPAGQPFDGTEGITAQIYRRTKQTSGSWGSALNTWNNYASQTYTADYTLYDYLWTIV